MADVNRSDIWWFGFPSPDRRRPVLVLTRQEIIPHLANVTVAPITTTIRGIQTEVVVGPECGLRSPSAVNLDNVATIPRAGLSDRIGRVGPHVMTEVRDALLFGLGFDPEGIPARTGESRVEGR
jgi:mRNA interferase MazF